MIKTKKFLLPAMITLAILASGIAAYAHGPETHVLYNKCTDEALSSWNANNCAPTSIVNGITHNSHPNGLCYPSFNNYKDSYDRVYAEQHPGEEHAGMDPVSSQPALFEDERYFFKAANGIGSDWTDFSENVVVEDGDQIEFYVYVHNNGDPCLNGDTLKDLINKGILNSNKYYSTLNTTSENTKLKIEPLTPNDFTVNNGTAQFDLTKQTTFAANIWSDNAIDKYGNSTSKTNPTSATVTLTPKNNEALTLKYKGSSAKYIDSNYNWEGEVWPINDAIDLFEQDGWSISTLLQGNIKGSTGDYFACEPYIGMVRFVFEAEEIPPAENICQDLTVTAKKVSGENEEPKYLLTPNVKFTVQNPANTQIKWTLKPTTSEEVTVEQGKLVSGNQASNDTITTNINDKVYFEGYGAVLTAEVIPNDLDPYDDCIFTMKFEPKEKPLICEEITVTKSNGQPVGTIQEGDTVALKASVKYTDETTPPTDSYVMYSVKSGYGTVTSNTDTWNYDTDNSVAIVKPGQTVTINVTKSGEDVITVREYSIHTPIPEDCIKTFNVTDKPVTEGMVCKDIEVVMPTSNGEKSEAQFLPIYEGVTIPFITYTTYEGENSPDPSYVIYVVQPGHGSIKPAPGVTPLLPPVIPTPNYVLVVKSGDMVIFTAGAEGTDVLKISEGSTYPVPEDCKKAFDIIPLPEKPVEPVCEEIIVEYDEPIYEGTVAQFTAHSLNSDGDEFDGDITYSVENGHGYFFTEAPTGAALLLKPIEEDSLLKYIQGKIEKAIGPLTPIGPSLNQTFPWTTSTSKYKKTAYAATTYTNITVAPGTTIYFYATTAGENVIHITTEGTNVEDCELNLDILEKITPPEMVCLDLEVNNYLTGTPLDTLEPGKAYALISEAKYNPAKNGSSVYSSTQGVFVAIPQDIDTFLENINATDLPNPVKNAIIRDIINKSLGEAIAGEIDSTNYMNYSLTTSIEVTDGQPVIFITFADANAGLGLTVQAKDRFEAVCIENFYIVIPKSPCESIVVIYASTPFNSTKETLIRVNEGEYGDFAGEFKFTSEHGTFYTPGDENTGVNPGNFSIAQSASGVVYSGGQTGDTVTIDAVGDYNGTNCHYIITETPGKIECLSLEIVQPAGTWTEDDFISGKDDEQRFKIEVETEPAGLANELTYSWEVSPSNSGEFDKDTTTLGQGVTNPLINYLRKIVVSAEPEVTVEAVGWENVCSDSIKLRIDDKVDYPDIEKYIFDTNNDKWKNTINLGGKDEDGDWLSSKYQYVTYLAIFDPGTSKSATIWEEEMDNGVIEAANTKDGEFEYLGMVIAATKKGGDTDDPDDGYILFKSEDFEDNEYEDDKVVDLENFENFDENMDFFEDNFVCTEANEGDLCIENNFDDLDEDFGHGRNIEFKNTDTVEKIYIIYQMENNTEITDEYCKDMIEEFGECGEEFENKIKFKAYTDDNFDDNMESGDDDALAIIICPFILTREGGDVFYSNALETGIDVSACYDVKSTPGVIIKPKPDEGETPSTGGTEEISQIVLSAPTHDVCKLSNVENLENPEQYQNILKNFSSSVCEMEAEVSEIWTEKYINEAIKANIEKIARFNVTKGPKVVTSMMDIAQQQLGDNQNGVFVIDGDLTIGSERNVFNVSPYSNIPAAQTYIVKNGTLKINGNIKYDDSKVNITNPKTIPSVAFIVIDGNIEIDNGVSQIDGILMAVDTNNSGDGEIKASPPNNPTYEETLTINGSLIGNVYSLFLNRRAIGDPLKDEGSVTIRYDERILLNTPPGLNELIDVSQLKTAR